MKYYALFFLKIKKDITNLTSAVVVIGTLRDNQDIMPEQRDGHKP